MAQRWVYFSCEEFYMSYNIADLLKYHVSIVEAPSQVSYLPYHTKGYTLVVVASVVGQCNEPKYSSTAYLSHSFLQRIVPTCGRCPIRRMHCQQRVVQ